MQAFAVFNCSMPACLGDHSLLTNGIGQPRMIFPTHVVLSRLCKVLCTIFYLKCKFQPLTKACVRLCCLKASFSSLYIQHVLQKLTRCVNIWFIFSKCHLEIYRTVTSQLIKSLTACFLEHTHFRIAREFGLVGRHVMILARLNHKGVILGTN